MKLRISILAITLSLYCFISCGKHNSVNSSTPTYHDTLLAWQKITSPMKSPGDIWFTSAARGFVCDSGAIYSSTDSGKTWLSAPGVTSHSYNLSFLNAQIGASVSYGFLYITKNGGTTWQNKPLPPALGTYPVVDIQLTSPSTAWLSTANGLFKSTDTCNTWSNVFSNAINGFFFFSDTQGFVYNASASPLGINLTTNGGINWQQVYNIPSSAGINFNIMQFTDRTHGWISMGSSLYGTADGGVTWTAKIPATSNMVDVQFIDTQTGYVAYTTGIYKTTDGGQTWTLSCKIDSTGIIEIFFLDANTGWAICENGTVLRLKQ